MNMFNITKDVHGKEIETNANDRFTLSLQFKTKFIQVSIISINMNSIRLKLFIWSYIIVYIATRQDKNTSTNGSNRKQSLLFI